MRRLLAAVIVVSAMLGAGAATASEKDKAVARTHLDLATRFFEVREYGEALKEYKAAYVALPEPAFLFNIAQCLRKLDRNAEALDFFQQYLKKAPPDDPNRSVVENHMRNIQAGLGADNEASRKPDQAAAPAPPPQTTFSSPPPAPGPALPVSPQPVPQSAPLPAAPVAATTAAGPAPLPMAAALTAEPVASEDAQATPIVRTWWFWTGVGAVVVAGAVTAIVLASGSSGTSIPDSSLGSRGIFQ